MPKRITRQTAEELNGITAARKRLLHCVKHAVYPPHLIIHHSKELHTDVEVGIQENKEPEPKVGIAEVTSSKAEFKDATEPIISQEKATEPKILCPIHDLYQDN